MIVIIIGTTVSATHANSPYRSAMNEYLLLTKHMPNVRTVAFYRGTSVQKDGGLIRYTQCPAIIVATLGRLNALARDKNLNAEGIKHIS